MIVISEEDKRAKKVEIKLLVQFSGINFLIVVPTFTGVYEMKE
jgi:hypothetical protein